MMTPFNFDFEPQWVFGPQIPTGYHGFMRRGVIGTGDQFEAKARLLFSWGVQRGSGLAVRALDGTDAPEVDEKFEGRVILPLLHFGALQTELAAPFRVTAVIESDDAAGFAYGTLPGHPEAGVEAFLVRKRGQETIIEVRAISRPASPYNLLPGIPRLLQGHYTRRYMSALLTR